VPEPFNPEQIASFCDTLIAKMDHHSTLGILLGLSVNITLSHELVLAGELKEAQAVMAIAQNAALNSVVKALTSLGLKPPLDFDMWQAIARMLVVRGGGHASYDLVDISQAARVDAAREGSN